MSDHVTSEQLSSLIDGELSLASREAVIAHVRACPACAARHDDLIEVAAALRAQSPLAWSETQTQTLLAQITTGHGPPKAAAPRQRDWTLPLASALALLGATAVVIAAPGLPRAALGSGGFDAVAAVIPGVGLLWSGHLVLALFVVAAIGIAALPLIRAR